MSDLPTLQQSFQHYLLDSDQKEIKKEVVSTALVSADQRLWIYAHAYKSRLVEALGVTYSALKMYVGDEKFYKLGSDYADQYPSTFRSIRWFGEHLANVLYEHPIYQNYPFLAELALLEWIIASIFDSEDADVLSIETLQHIPPERWMTMQLQPHPSLRRINLYWNVVPIWKAMNEEESPPEPQQTDSPVLWIFWRKELAHRFSPINQDEAWAIDVLLNGGTFGDICEGLAQWIEEEEAIALRAASLLKGWILAGLITSVSHS